MAGIGGRGARLASVALATMALVALLAVAAPAFAVVIDTTGDVEWGKCEACHANIADTKNYSQEIIFGHGLHILVECSSCHTAFPHRPEGTSVPTMQMCFNCHQLQHGPMGEVATGKCEDCHVTPQRELRPAFHGFDWKYEPHVKPGEDELQTKCMMCHDGPFCDECHAQEGIDWKPRDGKTYVYDPGDGCMACHGEEGLSKTVGGQSKSFQVTGVDSSAHTDVSCVQCHPDFKYEKERVDSTRLWDVNAGLACQNCHEHEEIKTDYLKSAHGQKLMSNDEDAMESATCASCHGGHYIQRLTDNDGRPILAAQNELQGAAYRVCARCHRKEWESYDDYYHGAAYKAGNTDAPACWDCHGAHNVLPSSDPSSTVAAGKLGETCGGLDGRDGCHTGSSEKFAEQAKDLIHRKVEAREANWFQRNVIDKVKGLL